MQGLSVVVELQPQLFLDPAAGCFVTGFDCYERIKAGRCWKVLDEMRLI